MHIHVLGIGGTFMGGLARLARALGHEVTGSDLALYPPMSDQLAADGIVVHSGYDPAHLEPAPDCVVIGNALSRGNPAVEHVLDQGLLYTSGPAWLAEHVLHGRWVLAVAGTHGKTTTSSMLAWVLEDAGLAPGFLIGGVPANFGVSARLGEHPFFVVEADEYDTAFFDKRSKFVHYRPRTLVLNNLEYDHADIFPDLASIQRQFHHLVRTVPASGLVLRPRADANIDAVLEMGCWTPVETLGTERGQWRARLLRADASEFEVSVDGQAAGCVRWDLVGRHNAANALAALAAARHAGVPPSAGCEALGRFRNARRRLELRGVVRGVSVYDDFAHHPTAIAATLEALRARVDGARILAVLEPRSNTMRMGVHRDTLGPSLDAADEVWLFAGAEIEWDPSRVVAAFGPRGRVRGDVQTIIEEVSAAARAGDHVLVMSNGGFENIHVRLLHALEQTGD